MKKEKLNIQRFNSRFSITNISHYGTDPSLYALNLFNEEQFLSHITEEGAYGFNINISELTNEIYFISTEISAYFGESIENEYCYGMFIFKDSVYNKTEPIDQAFKKLGVGTTRPGAVTFSSMGGLTSINATLSIEVTEDSPLVIPSTKFNNHTLNHIFYNNQEVPTVFLNNQLIYGKSFTISYDINGSQIGTTPPSQLAYATIPIKLPDVSSYNPLAEGEIPEELVYLLTKTITFNFNKGTGNSDYATIDVDLPCVDMPQGWSLTNQKNTSDFYIGQLGQAFTSAHTLYLSWKILCIANYTITFPSSSTVGSRSGYNFLGWSTNPNATQADFEPGESIQTMDADFPTIWYAIWEESQYSYVIKHKAASSSSWTTETAITNTTSLVSKIKQITENYTQNSTLYDIEISATEIQN